MPPHEIVETSWGERDAGSLRARLRPLARPVRSAIAELKAAYSLMGSHVHRGQPRVYFGFPRISDKDAVTVGGLVKLQALSGIFPSTNRDFNVLYLVTSGLPDGAVALARAA